MSSDPQLPSLSQSQNNGDRDQSGSWYTALVHLAPTQDKRDPDFSGLLEIHGRSLPLCQPSFSISI